MAWRGPGPRRGGAGSAREGRRAPLQARSGPAGGGSGLPGGLPVDGLGGLVHELSIFLFFSFRLTEAGKQRSRKIGYLP